VNLDIAHKVLCDALRFAPDELRWHEDKRLWRASLDHWMSIEVRPLRQFGDGPIYGLILRLVIETDLRSRSCEQWRQRVPFMAVRRPEMFTEETIREVAEDLQIYLDRIATASMRHFGRMRLSDSS